MPSSNPKPAEIRAARAYLQGCGIRSTDIVPRDFAAAAKEAGKGLAETLKLIASLQMAGQGQGPAPIATKIAEKGAR